MRATRRDFLGAAAAFCCGPSCDASAECSQEPSQNPDRPLLDLHMHLLGTGDAGSGCLIQPRLQEGHVFRALVAGLRIRQRDRTIDRGYELALAEHLDKSQITRGVVLSQDAIYDRAGRPDMTRTPFYVPNEYLFRIVARHPKMVPCVSINPQRRDALDELAACVDKGARILKIHPPIQGVDLSDRKHKPFFRACANAGVLVMVHTGHEHTSPIVDVNLANPRRLSLALDEGCTVVACHSGTGRVRDVPDMLPDFLAMIRRYDNLWGDTAVLGTRAKDLQRLVKDKHARSRLLHGSDFPFPALPTEFVDPLGLEKVVRLQLIGNLAQQDLELKEALEIGMESAQRAWRVVMDRGGPR